MYKLLLILKYLGRKIAPMLAALAVTLCTMMVIVVISVMGGFLDLLRTSLHSVSGDVSVGSALGVVHYEQLADQLEALPEVQAAAPIIETFGLINLRGNSIPVRILGIKPKELERVRPYRESLHWDTQEYVDRLARQYRPIGKPTDEELAVMEQQRQEWAEFYDLTEWGMTFEAPDLWQMDPEAPRRGAVIGIEVNPHHLRDDQGEYSLHNAALGEEITVMVAPLSERGVLTEPAYTKLVVVNESKSGVYEIDQNQIYVPFEVLQQLLDMDEETVYPEGSFDPETGELGEPVQRPARATMIVLKAAPGFDAVQARDAAVPVLDSFRDAHAQQPMLVAVTWEQQYGGLLGAVQNEKGLVTFLFIIISVVAMVMVLTTFYMIVLEKTRDIGVLRAIGAPSSGIMNIFLGYGLAVGVLGAVIGFGLAYAVVKNLNEIQNLIAALTGWQMWDPKIYFFDRIPSNLDPTEVIFIMVGAIISSVIGALVPAVLASWLNPVEALRYE